MPTCAWRWRKRPKRARAAPSTYPTRDGFILVAVGNDLQWDRLTRLPEFKTLANALRRTNAGRHREREAIHREMAKATAGYTTDELAGRLAEHHIPHAPIRTIEQVRRTEAIASKLTTTRAPDGRLIHLPPLAVDVEHALTEYPFAPRYGQDTRAVLLEAGVSEKEIGELQMTGVVALIRDE
jgi:crotonobetainyl-CoA:carnitine CoA-transferase CaiB-like acyl-CoA transferase